MPTNVRSSRGSQIVAWGGASLFLLGFFFSLVGSWTQPILGVWFVGTQKPRRRFLWMVAFSFIPGLLFGWRKFPLSGPVTALEYVGWMLIVAVLGVLPFTCHRLVSSRLPGFPSTLPFPLAAVVFQTQIKPLLHIGAVSGTGMLIFFIPWFAAVVVWMWNH